MLAEASFTLRDYNCDNHIAHKGNFQQLLRWMGLQISQFYFKKIDLPDLQFNEWGSRLNGDPAALVSAFYNHCQQQTREHLGFSSLSRRHLHVTLQKERQFPQRTVRSRLHWPSASKPQSNCPHLIRKCHICRIFQIQGFYSGKSEWDSNETRPDDHCIKKRYIHYSHGWSPPFLDQELAKDFALQRKLSKPLVLNEQKCFWKLRS